MKGSGGKEAVWEAVFARPPNVKPGKWVGPEVDSGTEIHKGGQYCRAMAWGGPAREFAPIQNSEFGADSDVVVTSASAKAADWLKTHPNEKLNLLLAKDARYTTPVWVVAWGDKKSGFIAVVNGTSGEVISPK